MAAPIAAWCMAGYACITFDGSKSGGCGRRAEQHHQPKPRCEGAASFRMPRQHKRRHLGRLERRLLLQPRPRDPRCPGLPVSFSGGQERTHPGHRLGIARRLRQSSIPTALIRCARRERRRSKVRQYRCRPCLVPRSCNVPRCFVSHLGPRSRRAQACFGGGARSEGLSEHRPQRWSACKR